MARTLNFSLLKSYGPSLPNRDDSGDAKQVVVGGVRRARISSQCLKRAIRNAMGINSIRTSHLEDCIELILQKKACDGEITSGELDKLGVTVCELLGCDWKKRASLNTDKPEKKDESKGRTVVVTNPLEILAVVNAVIKCGDDSGKIAKKAAKKSEEEAIKKAAKKALNDVRISIDKAMFGTMSTSGVLESIDGAVQVGQTYSIDEYIPESDFIVATFSEAKTDEDDPFYGCFQIFSENKKLKAGSEAMADTWLYSNTMYTVSSVDITELKNNLSRSIAKNDMAISLEDIVCEIKRYIGMYAETLAITEPAAKQNSMSTHSAPAILYIESVLDGNCQYADFNRVVRRKDGKEIAELGIEHILEFAKDQTFRTGDIKRYVMLSAPYKSYEKDFEESGIMIIHNLKELKEMIDNETERLTI